ncbi:MAG: hypothetical protein P3B98_09735 [Gemmatimonadota bacterium]|nr:hypothetical protein [Gemmatimonadota bacterium]
MLPIIIESALFAVLVTAVGALFFAALLRFTPLGVRWRQVRNRRLLEREAAHNCPRHGLQREGALVRLRDGQTMCPTCYQEILDGKLD